MVRLGDAIGERPEQGLDETRRVPRVVAISASSGAAALLRTLFSHGVAHTGRVMQRQAPAARAIMRLPACPAKAGRAQCKLHLGAFCAHMPQTAPWDDLGAAGRILNT